MKKKISLVFISMIIITIILGITLNNSKDSKQTFKKDGVLYAMTLDGESITSFPSKGLYRVDVECENATCTWLYDEWKLAIENITGDVSCDIDFVTITKTYLNNYVTSLAGTNQGSGKVVNETAGVPDWNSVEVISQSAYTNISTFSSTSNSSTSGTSVSGLYSYANGKWASDTSKMTSDTYYHFKFTPSESGYYQICCDLSSGDYSNSVRVYVDNTSYYLARASTSSVISGCTGLGYVSNSSYINVSQYAYSDSSYGIAPLSFSIKKVSTVSQHTDKRYEGKNPNNYIWFNDELWRIIGVFDSGSHGQSGKNLVKIIRNDSLGGLEWDNSSLFGRNDWNTSNSKNLLNGAYYNAQDGTNTDYCYGYRDEVKSNCDYRKKGIQTGYREMIQNVTWYLGGYSSTSATAASFYEYERGTTVYSGRPTSTTGYIGLMYPSDYGYSVLSSSCARTTNLNSYNTSSCAGQSWLYGRGNEWTLTPYSSDDESAFALNSAGLLDGFIPVAAIATRPTLYLKDSVYVIDGDGSLLDPYIISM